MTDAERIAELEAENAKLREQITGPVLTEQHREDIFRQLRDITDDETPTPDSVIEILVPGGGGFERYNLGGLHWMLGLVVNEGK
jgi:hypothetical protein